MQNIFFIMKMTGLTCFSTVIIIGSIISGKIDINTVPNNFNIGISNVKIDNIDITESAVEKNNITFTTKDLKKIGDTSILEYEISNNSKYDATLSMECTKNGPKSNYYKIIETTPETIKSNSTEKAYLTVTLVKESLTDSEENFYCKLNATAIEKN